MRITAIPITKTAPVKSEIGRVAGVPVCVWSQLCNWWMCFPSSQHLVINTPAPPHQQQHENPAPLSLADCSSGFFGNNCLAAQQRTVLWVMCSPADFDFSRIFRASIHSPVLRLLAPTSCFNKHLRNSIYCSAQSCQTWWYCFSSLFVSVVCLKSKWSAFASSVRHKINKENYGSLLKHVSTEHQMLVRRCSNTVLAGFASMPDLKLIIASISMKD